MPVLSSFNPLEIGSSVLIRQQNAIPTVCESRCCFNPLEIGSSVLIASQSRKIPAALKFQSPRNRVKCSDPLYIIAVLGLIGSFNPLEIGSSVLIGESPQPHV